jgi:histone acetyltransferase (RNA polymerase elongator complex component)
LRIYPFFITHAGCPHRCAFCRQEVSVGAASAPTADDVARQLTQMLSVGAGGEVAFYGGSFTLLPELTQRAYLEAVKPHLQSGAVSNIRISTRPDALAENQLALLQQHGVSIVEVGCQSFSATVLARSNRGHDPESSLEAVSRLRQYGFRVGIQLMPGLPGGSRAEALATLARAIRLKPDFLRIYPVVVLRDTLLARQYEAGLYSPPSLEEAVAWCAEMLWHCQRLAVPVIRIGLQSSPGLDRGDTLLAGPYHPAFGQLVHSRLWLRALQSLARSGAMEVWIHRSDLADALGNRRQNMICMQQHFPQFTLHVMADIPRQTLMSELGSRSLWELSAYPIEEFFFD